MEYFDLLFSQGFEHIAKNIFNELKDSDLCSSCLVCKSWNEFIQNQYFFYLRVISKLKCENNEHLSDTLIKRNKKEELRQYAGILKQCLKNDPYLFSSTKEDFFQDFKFLWKFQKIKNPQAFL